MRRGRIDADAAAFDLKAMLGEESYRLWIRDHFFFKDAGSKRIGSVVVENGTGALEDDGAGIVGVVDEVDGAAGDFAAVIDDGLVDVVAEHPFAAEGGEEGGVDVHGAAEVAIGEVEEAEPAGEADEIDVGLVTEGENRAAEIFDGGIVAALDGVGGEIGGGGALEALQVWLGADDEGDVDVELIGAAEIDEVLQGAA